MHRMTREVALWCVVALLAGALRLARLDFLLTDAEAAIALTSLAALRNEPVIFPNPLFGWLQMLLFAIFGASEVAARLIAALSGVGLCLLPAALRAQLGRTRALIFAGLLALSPTLWFVSREMGGAMLAWALTFAAYCAWRARHPVLAAAALGALLATGQDAVAPAIVTTLASLAIMPRADVQLSPRFVVILLVTFVLSATASLMRPTGLGDAFNGYALWVRTLTTAESIGIGRLMLGLVASEPVIWGGAAFGVAGLVLLRGRMRTEVTWLVWIAAGLGMLVIPVSRDAASLVPLVIGMAGLASAAYDALLASAQRWASWQREGAVAGIALVLLAYAGLGVWQYAGQGNSLWLVSVAVATLLILALIAAGGLRMDYGSPLRGVALAGIAALSLYSLSVGIQMNHARPYNPAEPYRAQAAAEGLAALQETIRLLSIRATGEQNALAVRLDGDAPAALRWALRDRRSLETDEASVVLTPATKKPNTTGRFIGMGFQLTAQASLDGARCVALPQGGFNCLPLARWLAFRSTDHLRSDLWVLWLREDVARRASGSR